MSKDYVRDMYGKIVGSYEEDNQGKITLRNMYGKILGTYNPKDNRTRDMYGRIVGFGNTLSRLLK